MKWKGGRYVGILGGGKFARLVVVCMGSCSRRRELFLAKYSGEGTRFQDYPGRNFGGLVFAILSAGDGKVDEKVKPVVMSLD